MPSKEKKQVILSSRNNREKQVVIKECDFLKDGKALTSDYIKCLDHVTERELETSPKEQSPE